METRYAVFFFGTAESEGARYDAGNYDDGQMDERPTAPIKIKECESYREAKRLANELNEAEGYPVSW